MSIRTHIRSEISLGSGKLEAFFFVSEKETAIVWILLPIVVRRQTWLAAVREEQMTNEDAQEID